MPHLHSDWFLQYQQKCKLLYKRGMHAIIGTFINYRHPNYSFQIKQQRMFYSFIQCIKSPTPYIKTNLRAHCLAEVSFNNKPSAVVRPPRNPSNPPPKIWPSWRNSACYSSLVGCLIMYNKALDPFKVMTTALNHHYVTR